jgi:Tol biopolymer transport system component
VWTWDLQRHTLTRVTSDSRADTVPIWTPDGKQLVFLSRRAGGGNLYRQRADGTGAAEPLTVGQNTFIPTSITSDGAILLGNSSIPRSWTLFALPLGKQAPAEPFLRSDANHTYPVASPNGRFVAYQSVESKRQEIYVRPFPNVNDGRSQVSAAGGSHPVWARNGRELFFLDASRRLVGVTVDTTGATFRAGLPVPILSTPYWVVDGPLPYDVSPDGMRFLMIKEDPAARSPNTPIVMMLNAISAPVAREKRQ